MSNDKLHNEEDYPEIYIKAVMKSGDQTEVIEEECQELICVMRDGSDISIFGGGSTMFQFAAIGLLLTARLQDEINKNIASSAEHAMKAFHDLVNETEDDIDE